MFVSRVLFASAPYLKSPKFQSRSKAVFPPELSTRLHQALATPSSPVATSDFVLLEIQR